MKLLSLLLEATIRQNAFFKVEKAFTVWALKHYKPSNEYYGSARIHKPVYEKLELESDDEIHWLHGGLFGVQLFNEDHNGAPGHSEKNHMIRLDAPKENSGKENWYLYVGHDLQKLVNAGTLSLLPQEQAAKVKYNRPA